MGPTGDFLEGINVDLWLLSDGGYDGSTPTQDANGHHQDDITFLGLRIRS